jgi:hypothetical protein
MIWFLPLAILGASVAMDDDTFRSLRDKAFRSLADGQRGAPESAMGEITALGLSPTYDYLVEHVGDLTHRMSEVKYHWLSGQYALVLEKTSRSLERVEPFKVYEQVDGEIARTVAFRQGKPGAFASAQEAKGRLKLLGQRYADEHRKLVVWNRPQWLAREAAIAIGEMRFGNARVLLRELREYLGGRSAESVSLSYFASRKEREKEILVQARKSWVESCGKFTGIPYKPQERP